MQEIEKIRDEVDQIHIELARLFRQRLALTQKIWEIKKAEGLPLIDQKREDIIIHRFDQSIPHADEQVVVQNFFKSVLAETRKYLEVKLK